MENVWIFEYRSGRPFAFSSDDGKSWLTQDGKPWAFAGDNGWLFSYVTGKALSWFSDNTFFSLDGKPRYFRSL